jgi:chromosome segregation ATPase
LLEEFTGLLNCLNCSKAKYLETTKKSNLAAEDIMNQKLLWEKLKIGESDAIRSLKKLEDVKVLTLSEIEASEQQEVISKFELSEIQRIHEELCAELASLQNANEGIVNPVLKAIQAQISELTLSIAENEDALRTENDRKQKLIGSIDDLEKHLSEKSDVLTSKVEALNLADTEPNRVSRQIDSMNKALNSLVMEQNIMHRKKDSLEKEILHQKSLQIETEKLKKTLSEKLDVNRKTLQTREHDIATIEASLGTTKLAVHELALQKVELNSQRKAVDNDIRHQMDNYSCAKMEYENLKRFLKKKRIILNSAREVLPKLQEQNVQALSNMNMMKTDLGNTRQILRNLKLEIDQGLVKLLAEETLNTDKKTIFDSVLIDLDEHEARVKNAINEGRKRRKIISVLNAQRDVKSREYIRALAKEREAKQHVKMKELTVLDLTKRCNELSNRLKEFSALFEVVKNERNKYVNLIQNSAQGLAEMKEKIRILTDEVNLFVLAYAILFLPSDFRSRY